MSEELLYYENLGKMLRESNLCKRGQSAAKRKLENEFTDSSSLDTVMAQQPSKVKPKPTKASTTSAKSPMVNKRKKDKLGKAVQVTQNNNAIPCQQTHEGKNKSTKGQPSAAAGSS